MPGAKQSKDFTAKIAGEQTVHFVHPPDQMAVDPAEDFASQKALKIHAWAAARIPAVLGDNIQIELFGYGLR